MPRIIQRYRKRKIVEISPWIMLRIIKKGARVVVFQRFITRPKQTFMTLASYGDAHYITSNNLAFPFTREKNGRLIPDGTNSPPLPTSHPS